MSKSRPDLYVRIMMTVIAISLAILAGKAVISSAIPEAQAALTNSSKEEPVLVLDAKVLKKFEAPDVQEVVILGDQKTFVVQQKDMVSVVRVDYFEK